MPALENLLAAAPAPRNALADAPDKFSGSSASGGDFDEAMNHALAPAAVKNPGGKNPPRPGRNSSTLALAAPLKTPVAQPSSANPTPAAVEKNGDKKTAANASADESSAAPDKNSSDLTSAAVPAAVEPLPAFLSLPVFTGFGSSALPPAENLRTGNTGPAETVPVVSVLPAAGNAQAATSTIAAADLNGRTASPAAQPENNFLLKNLAPTTAAEAVMGEKNMPAANPKNKLPAGGAAVRPEANDSAAATGADPEPSQKLAESPLNPGVFPGANDAGKTAGLSPAWAAALPAQNAGTGVATTDLPMKNPQKMNKVAGLDVKVLPVGETDSAAEKNLPLQLLTTPVRPADSGSPNLNFAFANGNGNTPVADNAPVLNVVDLPSLADARMRAVERTHDMMALHSMRIVESKMDSLSVVIKPAVGTELSLELRQRNGGVEAQATLTRGDHQFLSDHWSELQQRLEQRGVKLAPLGSETSFSANGNGQFQQNQAAREEAAQQASAFAEFASIGNTGGATARLAPIHDGWETWA